MSKKVGQSRIQQLEAGTIEKKLFLFQEFDCFKKICQNF